MNVCSFVGTAFANSGSWLNNSEGGWQGRQQLKTEGGAWDMGG